MSGLELEGPAVEGPAIGEESLGKTSVAGELSCFTFTFFVAKPNSLRSCCSEMGLELPLNWRVVRRSVGKASVAGELSRFTFTFSSTSGLYSSNSLCGCHSEIGVELPLNWKSVLRWLRYPMYAMYINQNKISKEIWKCYVKTYGEQTPCDKSVGSCVRALWFFEKTGLPAKSLKSEIHVNHATEKIQ